MGIFSKLLGKPSMPDTKGWTLDDWSEYRKSKWGEAEWALHDRWSSMIRSSLDDAIRKEEQQ